MFKTRWKIASTASLLAAMAGSAFAAAEISSTEISPTPRIVTGFSNPAIPINGEGIGSSRGRATFSIEFVESVDVQIKVNDQILPFPEAGTTAEDVDGVEFALGKDFGATLDEKNVVKIFSRPANSTESFSTAVTEYTVFVDRVKPNAPGSISADGADRTIVVSWSTPGKSGTEFFDNFVVTYDDEDFSTKSTAEVAALQSETVTANNNNNEAVLSGVDNGVEYFVTVRTVDWVGNVSDFPRDSAGNILVAKAEPVITVTLAELVGEEGGCFIATAAFGSYHERHVRILREFRDRVLLQSDVGRSFVAWYYQTSPPFAAWLVGHEWARFAVRIALWPLYAVAYVILHPAMILLLLPISVYFLRRRRASLQVAS